MPNLLPHFLFDLFIKAVIPLANNFSSNAFHQPSLFPRYSANQMQQLFLCSHLMKAKNVNAKFRRQLICIINAQSFYLTKKKPTQKTNQLVYYGTFMLCLSVNLYSSVGQHHSDDRHSFHRKISLNSIQHRFSMELH